VAADRPRIHIDDGRPLRDAAPHSRTSDRRKEQVAALRRGRNAARAPGAGARAASGGCGQGERADRPLVSRWKETRGTGLGADHRIPAAEELAREIDAALERLGAGGNAMKRMEGLTRRCLLAWP